MGNLEQLLEMGFDKNQSFVYYYLIKFVYYELFLQVRLYYYNFKNCISRTDYAPRVSLINILITQRFYIITNYIILMEYGILSGTNCKRELCLKLLNIIT